jgi:hypothetical protein
MRRGGGGGTAAPTEKYRYVNGLNAARHAPAATLPRGRYFSCAREPRDRIRTNGRYKDQAMSNSDNRDAARKKAQAQFASSEQRDNAIKQEIEKERAATAAKTAKLRALRLAKEATEKVEADRLAVEKAQASAAAKASRKKKASA